MLPGEDVAIAELEARFHGAFEELERVVETVVSICDRDSLIVSSVQAVDRLTIDVLLVQMSKACRTARAIRLVCGHGLGQDAGVLLRCLFEDWLCVNWLFAGEWRARARRVLAHDNQRKLVQVEEILRTPELAGGLTEATVARARANVDCWVQRLGQEEVEAVRKHWSGDSAGVEGVARSLGALRIYNTLYREMSGYAHGSDFVANVDVVEGVGVAARLAPSDYGLPLTPLTAAWLLWTLANLVNENLGLGFNAQLAASQPRGPLPTKAGGEENGHQGATAV